MKMAINRDLWVIFGWAAVVTLIRAYFTSIERLHGSFELDGTDVIEPLTDVFRSISF